MRRILPLVVAFLLPAAANAEKPYVPRFARVEQPASMLDYSLFCRKPEWPKASLRNKEQGVTTVRMTVAPNGRLTATAVTRSSGFRDLDKAAQRGIELCAFEPASINGVPVQGVTYLQYVWTLE